MKNNDFNLKTEILLEKIFVCLYLLKHMFDSDRLSV